MMKTYLEKWSYDEFLTFLLMYASAADFTISDEEKKMMTDKIGHERYNQIAKLFKNQSDYESLQTILFFEDKYYPRPEDKEIILQDLKKLLLADRDLTTLESNMLLIMKKIL